VAADDEHDHSVVREGLVVEEAQSWAGSVAESVSFSLMLEAVANASVDAIVQDVASESAFVTSIAGVGHRRPGLTAADPALEGVLVALGDAHCVVPWDLGIRPRTRTLDFAKKRVPKECSPEASPGHPWPTLGRPISQ
jgi:hypothetical protein